MVEQRFCKPKVGGSTLSPGTRQINDLARMTGRRRPAKAAGGNHWGTPSDVPRFLGPGDLAVAASSGIASPMEPPLSLDDAELEAIGRRRGASRQRRAPEARRATLTSRLRRDTYYTPSRSMDPTASRGVRVPMIPPALAKDQLKVVLDYSGFVPRRLRRKFLKDIAAQLPVAPGHRRRAREPRRDREIESFPGKKLNRAKQKDRQHNHLSLNQRVQGSSPCAPTNHLLTNKEQ